MKLQKYLKLTAVMTAETGLRIGGASDKVEIGGVDNIIVKNPQDGKPYIPGSSLKGKLRTLLEYDTPGVKVGQNAVSCTSKEDKEFPIVLLFGNGDSDANKELKIGPARFIARDAKLTEEFESRLVVDIVEVKFENSINRLTGTALNPRQAERVAAGVQFNVEFVCRVFEDLDEKVFNENIPRALELLEFDCLGGYGSRGYGKVSFSVLKLNHSDTGNTEEFATVAEFKAKKSTGKAAA